MLSSLGDINCGAPTVTVIRSCAFGYSLAKGWNPSPFHSEEGEKRNGSCLTELLKSNSIERVGKWEILLHEQLEGAKKLSGLGHECDWMWWLARGYSHGGWSGVAPKVPNSEYTVRITIITTIKKISKGNSKESTACILYAWERT